MAEQRGGLLDVDGAALEAPVDGDRSGAVLQIWQGRRSSGMKAPLSLEGARGEAGRRGWRVAGRRQGSVGPRGRRVAGRRRGGRRGRRVARRRRGGRRRGGRQR